jgi:BirA family transcriptional regulator, biotin operon repressor / biotin---[acetyl-CoA-carboxylase] ligase
MAKKTLTINREWESVKWPGWIRRPMEILDQTDSTNNYARQLALHMEAPEGTLVIAEEQTAGRGKMGRLWHSPHGLSIYASVVLRPTFDSSRTQAPTLLAAAAVAASLIHLYGIPARVKWPNDILIEGKKVGGILTESMLEQGRILFLIMGLGLNCAHHLKDWPADLKKKAVSISQAGPKKVDRGQLLSQILRIFEKDYRRYSQGDYEEALLGWKNFNETLGRIVRIQTPGGFHEGKALDILSDGALVIRNSDGGKTETIRLGEVMVEA